MIIYFHCTFVLSAAVKERRESEKRRKREHNEKKFQCIVHVLPHIIVIISSCLISVIACVVSKTSVMWERRKIILRAHQSRKCVFILPGEWEESLKINRFLLYSLYFMNVFLRNSKNKNMRDIRVMSECVRELLLRARWSNDK